MESDGQGFTDHQMQSGHPQCALKPRPWVQLQANEDKDRADEIKKERNRAAARKHREKGKLKALEVQQQNQDLEKRKSKFQFEVDLLTKLEVQYKTLLLDHCTSCVHCRCRAVPCLVNRPPPHSLTTPVTATQTAAPPFFPPGDFVTPSVSTRQEAPTACSFLQYRANHTPVGNQGSGVFSEAGSVMSMEGGEAVTQAAPQPFPYDLILSSLPTMQVPASGSISQYQAGHHVLVENRGYGVSDTPAARDGYRTSGVMPEVAEQGGEAATSGEAEEVFFQGVGGGGGGASFQPVPVPSAGSASNPLHTRFCPYPRPH